MKIIVLYRRGDWKRDRMVEVIVIQPEVGQCGTIPGRLSKRTCPINVDVVATEVQVSHRHTRVKGCNSVCPPICDVIEGENGVRQT
jgi:hypothetical protein